MKTNSLFRIKRLSLFIFAFLFTFFSFSQEKDNRLQGLLISISNYEQLEILLPYLTNLDSIPSIFPLKDYSRYDITSEFGSRFHPVEKIKKFHKGIDIASEIGTLVIATADGRVESIKFSQTGHGRNITIEHNYGFITKYSHLAIILVSENSNIKKGDVIGMVGSTGKSTGNHLHYEVIKNKLNINPKDFFSITR